MADIHSETRSPGVTGTVHGIAAVSSLCGASVLVGWQLRQDVLKGILPGAVAMNPLTAVTFVTAAATLVLLSDERRSRRVVRAGRFLAVAVAFVGLSRLSDLTGWTSLGFDQLLFHDRLAGDGSLPPNRIAPNTALAFTLLGGALLALRRPTRLRIPPAQALGLACGGLSLLAVLGYLLEVDQLYRIRTFIPMALNTALLFGLLSSGVLLAEARRGLVAVFFASGSGGLLMRRVMPFAVLVPIALAWLRIRAERSGAFETEQGVSVMVFTSIVLLSAFIWANATRVAHVEEERAQALAALERAHDELERRVKERTSELERSNEALRRSEDQLRQAQKLEAIGQLAGGVAHDFNNLLTAIVGFGSLLKARVRDDATATRHVDEVLKASDRAAGLTRQLLAFSRQQVLQPKVLDLNAVVTDMDRMLRRLIGEDIDLVTAPDRDLGRVKADPGQLEQVLLNLVVNARDAMTQGGKLTIETANVELDEAYAGARAELRPGHYVMLAVSDTGCGMPADVRARIFEPFFTTKERGRGTGLGLSTVHGIVKQSDGHIEVYSELGHGTTFKVYLPRVEAPLETPALAPHDPERVAGTETILLVEDDEPIRRALVEALRGYGYTVLEATDGSEAVAICDRDEPIALLVTDVVMPLMSGPELARRVSALRPRLNVLFMSGYTDRALIHQGLRRPGSAFLQKPFTPVRLAAKIRELLDDAVDRAA